MYAQHIQGLVLSYHILGLFHPSPVWLYWVGNFPFMVTHGTNGWVDL